MNNIFQISGINADIFINNVNFLGNVIGNMNVILIQINKNIYKGNSLFSITNTKSNFIINDSIFSSNTVKSNLIDIRNIRYQSFTNTQCLLNNFNNINKEYLGGCFRSHNVNERIYSNVTISFCYSDFTTIGIKIVDEENIIINNQSKV